MARTPSKPFSNATNSEVLPFCETQVSATVFDSWLTGKSRTAYGNIEGTKTPRQALQAMVDTQLELLAPDGTPASMSIMEGIMARYTTMALQGDREAIQGIIKELQHDGVQKVAVAHVDSLPPGAKFILDQLGYDPEKTLEGTTFNESDLDGATLLEDTHSRSTSFLDGMDD